MAEVLRIKNLVTDLWEVVPALTGAHFTPSISSTGVISWTNDGGLVNPPSVDLAGAVLDRLPQAEGEYF